MFKVMGGKFLNFFDKNLPLIVIGGVFLKFMKNFT